MAQVRTHRANVPLTTTSPQIEQQLRAIRSRWLEHPYGRAEAVHFAEQYRRYVTMLPHFVNGLAAQLPTGMTQQHLNELVALLTDEPSDIELYDAFATSISGRTHADASSATKALLEAFSEALVRGPSTALGSLLATQSISRSIARLVLGACRDTDLLDGADTTYWDCLRAEPPFNPLLLTEPSTSEGKSGISNAWFTFLWDYQFGVATAAA